MKIARTKTITLNVDKNAGTWQVFERFTCDINNYSGYLRSFKPVQTHREGSAFLRFAVALHGVTKKIMKPGPAMAMFAKSFMEGDHKKLVTGKHSYPDSIHVYIYIHILTVSMYIYIIEGSLEVKLPTIWTVEKQR